MVKLVISDNEGTTTVVPLLRDEITIGRKEGNTIRLTERNISRQHVHLLRQDGVYKLRDLDSYNGVLINGRRVQGESALTAGDQIQIGDYTILVEEEAAKLAAPESAPAAKRPATPARFVMLSEPSPGAEFSFPEDRALKLGRSEDVECPINHRSVSREHAEVKCADGAYSVSDLGSANGITVNGQVVSESKLKSGDVIELGQVVFRYVEPGEHYFFDAAEAARYRGVGAGNTRVNVRMAAIVIGAALVIATLVVMSGAGEDPAPSETVTQLSGSQAPTSTLADDGYDRAVDACRAALSGSRFAEALAHAALAAKVRANAPEAQQCEKEAQALYEDEQTYVRGEAALEAGDVDTAYQELSRLSRTSTFRSRPEVAGIAEQAARTRVTQARSLVQSAPADAVRIAQSVLAMSDAPRGLRAAAEQIVSDARGSGTDSTAAAARTAPATARSSRLASPQPKAAAAPDGVAAMDVAGACLARGDNDCVIRALAGRASTAQELGLLIETYRATGDTKQAQKNMAIYVKRFPTARRADAYRRMLELQGQ
jgi:ABC transport system ATP-binding/permease protein